MKLYIFIVSTLYSSFCLSQNGTESLSKKNDSTGCICHEQMKFVIEYIEANNPAYQKIQANKRENKKYTLNKLSLVERSKFENDTIECLHVLKDYVTSIKDHHTNIFLFKQTNANTSTERMSKPYEYKVILDSINYVRLSSFDGKLEKELNTFYDSIAMSLMSKPYLVVDLRDNGGGNDVCYHKLMRFIYTNPIEIDDCEVWASEENIRLYSKYFAHNKALIQRMKESKINSFVTVSKNQIWKIENKTSYPLRVFILQNKGMASSAEDFVFYAHQSKKVTTIGTNTGGYTGFGNVMTVYTPNKLFQLQTTTTRYKKGSKFEYVGHSPDIKIQDFTTWEIIVVDAINKK
jgi:hypothetical protein